MTNTGATESGEDVVVNQHYQTVARLKATDGWVLTLHEFVIDGDDAWVTANKNVPMDLSKYGGAYNGALIDSAVQEYDLKTGKLLRNWDALDAHPAERVAGVAADQRVPVGRLPRQLDRARSATARSSSRCATRGRAYLVNIDTGKIEWTLGGEKLELQVRPGRRLPVAARRAGCGRARR